MVLFLIYKKGVSYPRRDGVTGNESDDGAGWVTHSKEPDQAKGIGTPPLGASEDGTHAPRRGRQGDSHIRAAFA